MSGKVSFPWASEGWDDSARLSFYLTEVAQLTDINTDPSRLDHGPGHGSQQSPGLDVTIAQKAGQATQIGMGFSSSVALRQQYGHRF